jgi:hypothetical protein
MMPPFAMEMNRDARPIFSLRSVPLRFVMFDAANGPRRTIHFDCSLREDITESIENICK